MRTWIILWVALLFCVISLNTVSCCPASSESELFRLFHSINLLTVTLYRSASSERVAPLGTLILTCFSLTSC